MKHAVEAYLAGDREAQLLGAFIAREQANRWALCRALERELIDVLLQVRDGGVARIKLAWWENELVTAQKGQPSHPLTRALVAIQPAQSMAAWRQAAHDLATEIDAPAPQNLDGLIMRCESMGAALSGQQDLQKTAPGDAAITLASLVHLRERLLRLRAFSAAQRELIPLGWLARYQIPRADLAGCENADRVRGLLSDLASALMQRLEKARQEVESAGVPIIQPIYLQTLLAGQWLNRVARHGEIGHAVPFGLGLLGQCWQVWRGARRYKQLRMQHGN